MRGAISLFKKMKLGGGLFQLTPCLTNAYWRQGSEIFKGSYNSGDSENDAISQSFDDAATSDSNPTINLLTDEQPAGLIKNIKIRVSIAGYVNFIACRNNGDNSFRVLREFRIYLASGNHSIDCYLPINEPFNFGIRANSATIKTKASGASTGITLYAKSGVITDALIFSVIENHSHNISITTEVTPVLYNQYPSNRSVCYIGDSITEFADDVNFLTDVYNVGFDKIINESVVFTEIFNRGYASYTLGKKAAFASIMDILGDIEVADVYTVLIGTNDWALREVPLGVQLDYDNDTGNATFYGAYRILIDHLRGLNPDCEIILCNIPQRNNNGFSSSTDTANVNGDTYTDFNTAISYVNTQASTRLADLENNGYAYADLAAKTSDLLHPNSVGYIDIASAMLDKLQEFVASGSYIENKIESGYPAQLKQAGAFTSDAVDIVAIFTNRLLHLLDTSNSWTLKFIVKRSTLGAAPLFHDYNNYGISIGFNSTNVVQILIARGVGNRIYIRTLSAVIDTLGFHEIIVKYNGSKDESGLSVYINNAYQSKTIVENTLVDSDIADATSSGSQISGNVDSGQFGADTIAGFQVWSSLDDSVQPDIVDIAFSEGGGLKGYDSTVNTNHALIQGTTLTAINSIKQDILFVNEQYGFDLWSNGADEIRVRFDKLGNSILTDGDTAPEIGYTWVAKIPARKSVFYNSDTSIDLPNPLGGTDENTFDELEASIDNTLKFANIETGVSIDKSVFYSIAPTGDCLTKTLKYIALWALMFNFAIQNNTINYLIYF